MTAYDFLGNEIRVGCTVVCTELKYRNFVICEVSHITNKMVYVIGGKFGKFKQAHDQVIVLPIKPIRKESNV